MSSAPPPADVGGNQWTSLAVEPPETFRPTLPVSVIVTYYEAPEALELTLAALEGQDYPRELFEVVIVDDGSRLPLEAPADSPLPIRVVHQEDMGFGLARARNTGAHAASNPILVFLDCDMMPEADWLSGHARWHHAASDVLTLGFRAHVDVAGIGADDVRGRAGSLEELFAGRPWTRPEWIEFHMTRTDDLTREDDIFRAVTGGNLGVSAEFYETVGGYDESFTQWGTEDTEFGYRSYTRGGLLVPARDAMCWHQGEGAAPSADESASLELQRAKISQLIAHYGFRRATPGRSFTVPQHVVTLRATGSGDVAQIETVEQILAGKVHDLVVWIEEPPGGDATRSADHEKLRRLLAGDHRVRFGGVGAAVEAFPAASFHITMPGDATVGPDAISRLRRQLGADAAASTNPVDPQMGVSIVRAWALHRAARRGVSLAQCEAVTPIDLDDLDVDDLAQVATDAPRLSLARVVRAVRWFFRRTVRRLRRLRHFLSRNIRRVLGVIRSILREASRIRSLDDAREFCRWAASSVGVIARKRLGEAGVRLRYHKQAHYRLGPRMAAAGPVATAVFASAAEVDRTISAQTQVVLADTPDHGRGLPVDTVVILSEMDPSASVPAFDDRRFNPRGWNGAHRSSPTVTRSVLRRGLDPHRLRNLNRAHHMDDSADQHPDVITRAGVLATVAATGMVVRITEPDPELGRYLGSDLYSLMIDDRVATAGTHERESLSIAMRRCALRDHSLRARTRQILAGTGRSGPPLPLVSVLLATRRPHRVAAAVEAVTAQTYPRVELVLAMHGEGFDAAAIDELLGAVNMPSRAVPVAADRPLGAVLNAAVAESTGTLLTKFDDDDYYGPEHLWDLVLAQEYSRAALVGKAAEYVYLANSDRTVHRFRNRAERLSASLAGGTMMIARHRLDELLGWREIPASVDRALIEDVTKAGWRTYQTHGMGYMLVRHDEGHTWPAKDAYFLKQADEVREGCDLGFAGVA